MEEVKTTIKKIAEKAELSDSLNAPLPIPIFHRVWTAISMTSV
ncbi:hypothetical protein [Haloplanus pelagicus]|jgi:hypothetical protein|nr:hypothetical protein [Haloplanus sp. HW8-1]